MNNATLKGLLNEAGIDRWPTGWKKRIECSGPPGLLSWEQDLNRLGGRLVGQNALEALHNQIEAFENDIIENDFQGHDNDELSWIRDWLRRADAYLESTHRAATENVRPRP